MNAYETLKEIMCDELEKIAERGELTTSTLDTAHKLTDTIKNIEKIEALEGGHSSDGDWRAEGTYENMERNSYRRRNSHNNGRGYLMEQMREMAEDGSISPQSRTALRRAMDTLRRE